MKTVFASLLLIVLLPQITFAQEWQWTTPSKGEQNISVQTEDSPTGLIRISEVMANPVGSDTGNEWIELENYGTEELSVHTLSIALESKGSLSLANQAPLQPGEFRTLTLSTSLVLRNSGDTLLLKEQNIPEPVHTFPYPKADSEGKSTSLICTTSTNCSLHTTVPTPGRKNILAPLTIEASQESGIFTEPFQLALTLSEPQGKIFYTFDAEDQDLSNAIEYTSPISITDTTDIWFFGIFEDTSTPISTLQFMYTPSTTSKTARITELTNSFIEIDSSESFLGWICEDTTNEATCTEVAIKPGLHSYPYISDLSEFKELSLVLAGTTIIIDTLENPPIPAGSVPRSLSRVTTPKQLLHRQWFTTLLQRSTSFWWTQLPTPAKPNLFMLFENTEQDTDRDGLSDTEEEQTYGTNIQSYDTDGDQLPDGFEVFHNLDPNAKLSGDIYSVYTDLYKDDLTRFISFIQEDGQITGTALPLVTILLLETPNTLPISTTTADAYGNFSLLLNDHSSGWLLIKDRSGVTGRPIPLQHDTHPKKEVTPSFLLRALPNPDGADKRTQEFIALTNTSSSTIELSDYDVLLQEQKLSLPPMTLSPNETLFLTGETLQRAVPNSNLAITIAKSNHTITTLRIEKATENTVYSSTLLADMEHTTLPAYPSNENNSTATFTTTHRQKTTPTKAFVQIPTGEQLLQYPTSPTNPHRYWVAVVIWIGASMLISLTWPDIMKLWKKYQHWKAFRHMPQGLAFEGYSNHN